MAQYLPAPLEVPVTFYAAGYDGRAWRLSSQLEVIEVLGGHTDCMTTGAKLLVDHLRQRIDVLADRAPPSLNRTRLLTPAGLKGAPSPSCQPIVGAAPSNNNRGL
jgi:hypothetical protein